MTDHITLPRSLVDHEIEALVESARLLGSVQSRKAFGTYTQDDARFETAMYESIYKHKEALRAALAGAAQAEPVATYMGHRLTPDGTKEFWGLADTPLARGTKLYTTPQPAQPVAVPQSEPFDDVTQLQIAYVMGLRDAAPTPSAATVPVLEPLTEREVELIDGMIEVQLHHAKQCDGIANRTMAEKQKGWDMERVELLRKLKAAHNAKLAKLNGITPPAEGGVRDDPPPPSRPA